MDSPIVANTKRRAGGLSNDERKFILANMNKMSPGQMADQLGRHIAVIEKVIKTHVNLPQADSESARNHLRRSIYWKHLKEGFSEGELNYIEDQYVKYIQQFKGDIVATEEVQMLDLIKIEVLKDRNLKGKQNIIANMTRYSEMVESMLGRVNHEFSALSKEEMDIVMDLQNKIQSCMQAESARTTEYAELQKQHNALADKVMGSRDQRIKEIINTKVSFTGLVKQLIERDKQEKESRFLQLHKMAAEKELDRLSQLHTYADNVQDNPILCADVVEKLDKEDNSAG